MFGRRGYTHFRQAFSVAELGELVEPYDRGRAGKRIANSEALSHWLRNSPKVTDLLGLLGHPYSRPVRAILFDKSAATNWALGWHQDRTICVKQRVETLGYGPFTTKAGLVHVEPPFEIIERMATIRFHLDPVDDANAPLRVASASHLIGKIPVGGVEGVAQQSDIVTCYAQAGDAWAYSTPILHASERSRSERRRRVLQVDFSPDRLAGELEWVGV